MRTWVADLTGLVIGFAIGGAALVHVWPQIAPAREPPAAAEPHPTGSSQPVPVRRLPAVVTPDADPPPAPDIAMTVPPPAPLPQIVTPDQPDPGDGSHSHGRGVAGTGFFVADNLLLTSAHVVDGCRHAEIMSPFVRPAPVHVAARDTQHDIALLDAPRVRAPASLAIGRPRTARERVFILGYPAGSGPLVPQETWGTLENDKLPPEPAALTDPREQIWMEAEAVTHGYSGGPIFDPQSGKVVGIVRATVDGRALRGIHGMPASGIAIGPGSSLLDTFLQDEAPGTDAFPADQWGDDPLTIARRATVHVVCWF